MTKMTDDEMQRMPWTKYLMTNEELREWVASRGEAGRAIDIETCELGSWAAYDADPYGVHPELPEEMQQVGTNRFVRSSESRGWVHEGDLPAEKGRALYARIYREAEAYKALEKQFSAAANTLKLKDETDFDTYIDSHWDTARILRDAVEDFAAGRGVLDVGTIRHFVLYALEAGIARRRNRPSAPPTPLRPSTNGSSISVNN